MDVGITGEQLQQGSKVRHMKISVPNTDNEKLEDGTYMIVIVVGTLRINPK